MSDLELLVYAFLTLFSLEVHTCCSQVQHFITFVIDDFRAIKKNNSISHTHRCCHIHVLLERADANNVAQCAAEIQVVPKPVNVAVMKPVQ